MLNISDLVWTGRISGYLLAWNHGHAIGYTCMRWTDRSQTCNYCTGMARHVAPEAIQAVNSESEYEAQRHHTAAQVSGKVGGADRKPLQVAYCNWRLELEKRFT